MHMSAAPGASSERGTLRSFAPSFFARVKSRSLTRRVVAVVAQNSLIKAVGHASNGKGQIGSVPRRKGQRDRLAAAVQQRADTRLGTVFVSRRGSRRIVAIIYHLSRWFFADYSLGLFWSTSTLLDDDLRKAFDNFSRLRNHKKPGCRQERTLIMRSYSPEITILFLFTGVALPLAESLLATRRIETIFNLYRREWWTRNRLKIEWRYL